MITITSISIERFQGATLTQPLSPATLFIGPNASGKSVRLRAVSASLRGISLSAASTDRVYLPGAPEGRVTLTLSDGRTLSRDLADKAASKEGKASQAAVEAALGVCPLAYDASNLATASPTERGAILRSLATGGGDWDIPRVVRAVADRMGLAEIPATTHPLAVYQGRFVGIQDPGAWLDAAVDASAKTLEAANADARASSRIPAVPRNVPDLEKSKADAAKAWAELATYGMARDSAEYRRESARLLEEERRAMSEAETPATPCPPVPPDADARAKLAGQLASALEEEAALREWQTTAEEANSSLAGQLRSLGPEPKEQDVCVHCGVADPLGEGDRRGEWKEAKAALEKAKAEAVADLAVATPLFVVARSLVSSLQERMAAAKAQEAAHSQWARGEEDRQARVSDAKTRLNHVSADLAALEARLNPPPQDFLARIATLEADVNAAIRGGAAREAYSRAVAERRRAEEAQNQASELRRALLATRTEYAGTLLTPFVSEADRVLESFGSPLRVWFAGDGSSFGAHSDGAEKPFHLLSHAQRSLVGAALSVASARVSRQPYRLVMIDCMEQIDAATLPGVLAALSAGAEAGEYQFLGAFQGVPSTEIPRGVVPVALPARAVGGTTA